MSNKNYPTRMHVIFGMEPGEVFAWKDMSCNITEYVLDNQGHLYRNSKSQSIESPRRMAEIINHLERIIRLPKLTEEQVRELKALHTLGFRWLVKNEDGNLFAYDAKPEKRLFGRWDVFALTKAQAWFSKTLMISNLVSWSDPEPLDIVQTLRANGVEVEA